MREGSLRNCKASLRRAFFAKQEGFFAWLARVQICWQAIWTFAFHAWEMVQIVDNGIKMLQCRSMKSCFSPYFLSFSWIKVKSKNWLVRCQSQATYNSAGMWPGKAWQGNSNCVGLEAFDGFFLVALSLLSRCQWAAANFPGQMGLSTGQQGML